MNDRYIRLFSTEKNLYIPTSPVLICAGVLLKDNETKRLMAQIKFRSISSKEIKSILLELTLFDSADRIIGDKIQYTYLDLQLKRDEETGHKEPVFIRETNTRAFDVVIKEVVFSDKTVWTANAEWKSLAETKTLIEYFDDSELAEQYSIDCGEQAVIIPQKIDDIWICTCGKINFIHEKECHNCLLGYEEMAANLDVEKLRSNLIQRKYHEGIELMEQGMDMNSCNYLNKAISYFEKTDNFEDSALKITECNSKIAEIKAEKEAEKVKRIKHIKKIVKITTPIIILCIIFVVVLNTIIIPSNKYKAAMQLINEGNYMDASSLLSDIADYKDVPEHLRNVKRSIALQHKNIIKLIGVTGRTIGLKSDGTVVAEGYNHDGECNVSAWKDIVDIYADNDITVGLKSDGSVVATGELLSTHYYGTFDVSSWKNIVDVDISLYGDSVVGLKSDGTVVATGYNEYGQCNVETWTDIVDVYAGNNCTIGLKSDGTVVATGKNEYGQCNVETWTDVVEVYVDYGLTVGLKSDGTVVSTNDEYKFDGWCDVDKIYEASSCIIGLKKDGTVVATGNNKYNQLVVNKWTEITDIFIEGPFIVGLKKDGTVLTNSDFTEIDSTINSGKDIVDVAIGSHIDWNAGQQTFHVVLLRSDGTVVSAGTNNYGQCNVYSWTDVIAVYAVDAYTVGLKSDGTVVATGDNEDGQCSVSGWDLF